MADDQTVQRLALLAHELQAPAGVLAGCLKLLADDPDLPARPREILALAQTAHARLHALLEDLRELLRLETGQLRLARRAVPLAALAADAVARAAARGYPGVAAGAMPDVILHIDGDRVAAALAALIEGAAHPDAGGAALLIEGALDTGDTVRLTIGPPGAACASEPVPLDLTRGGLGLSQPLAVAVVEAHGGIVREHRAADGRRLIEVVLPLA